MNRYGARKRVRKPINEESISFADLVQVVPDDAIEGIAANLMKDIMNTPPPFRMMGGQDLYRYGSAYIDMGDDAVDIEIEVPLEFGKQRVFNVIEYSIGDIEDEIDGLGLDKKEMIEKIGLMILSNLNTMNKMHNTAISLLREIGEEAWNANEGKVTGDGGLVEYMTSIIDEKMVPLLDIKEKYHLKGLKYYIEQMTKQGFVADYKTAINHFNDTMNTDTFDFVPEIDTLGDYEPDVENIAIETAFRYLVNPKEFLRNSGIIINLKAYEEQFGKIPRQYDIPGIISEPKKEEVL